jgi:hypothetical protein
MTEKRSERTDPATRAGPDGKAKAEEHVSEKPLCFVIGPIGAAGSETRKRADMLLRYIIKAALENNYYVKRADEDAIPGSITDQLIVDINEATLIIADLSSLNPNAFYELGVAHALGKKVIHMSDSEQLPFDIRDYRSVLFDPTDPERHDKAVRELKAASRALTQEKHQPLNPVSRALGRHEAVKSQDAKQPSIEQMFGDVDSLKSQMAELRHMMRREVRSGDAPKIPREQNVINKLESRLTQQDGVVAVISNPSSHEMRIFLDADLNGAEREAAQETIMALISLYLGQGRMNVIFDVYQMDDPHVSRR